MVTLRTRNDKFLRAMSHPTKRKIIECLNEADLSFTEVLTIVGSTNHGKFGYHLRGLKEFVELELSTKKYRLTVKGRILARLIHDFRSAASMNQEYEKYAENLGFGDHAFALYGSEDFRRKVSLPFIRAGLTKGEAVMYLVTENRLDSEVREVQRCGIGSDRLKKGALTIMSSYEWYIASGKAHAETLVANLMKLIKEKEKAGFTGLRGVGEMEVFFDYGKSQELMRYEELLGRQYAGNVSGLCLYSEGKLGKGQSVRVYRSHGHIIQKGIMGKTVV